jgi:arsenite/tail-anchored protein-transporting ATPase
MFAGKGGVGKTTVATAHAAHAARSGIKTLVMSTDAAHSLADCLGQGLPPGAVTEVEPTLSALQVDVTARLDRGWPTVQGHLNRLFAAADADPMQPADLAGLPGADDVLTLLALRDQVLGGPWDLVVVDCAPTAETLRLLALPEVLVRLVDRLLPGRWASRWTSVGPVLSRAAGLEVSDVDLAAAVSRLGQELIEALRVVRGPGTSVRLVLTPEAVVLAETRRMFTALALQGLTVDAVIANRVVPDDPDASAWQTGWVRAQRSVLTDVGGSFGSVGQARIRYLPTEPVGAQALSELGRALIGPGVEALMAEPVRPAPLRVRPDGPDFDLLLDLPLARAQDVDLSRRADDLILVVAGRRRIIALPPVLHRHTATGARVRDGALQIRFVPGPADRLGR